MKVGTDAMVLGAKVNPLGVQNALDIGAGTGVLSLMLAQRNPVMKIVAIEIDADAAQECDDNFKHSPWSESLRCVNADFLNWSDEIRFDLIVSNPPFYVDGLEGPDQKRNTARQNSALPFDMFFKKVASLLHLNGTCWIIVPAAAEKEVVRLANDNGLYLYERVLVYGKPAVHNRSMLCFEREQIKTIESELTIRNADGSYTKAYKDLTIDFHGIPL